MVSYISSFAAAAAAAAPAFHATSRFAFTGSRHRCFSSSVAWAVARGLRVSHPGAAVSVGCALGVDSAVWAAFSGFGGLSVFRAAGRSRGALAARSVLCLRSALPVFGGCCVAFPGGRCPAGVVASLRFAGWGSGTWGSVGLALGLGLRVVLFVPAPFHPAVFAGGLSSRFAVVSSGPWGAWLVAPPVFAPALF